MSEGDFDPSELRSMHEDAKRNRGNNGCVRYLKQRHPDKVDLIDFVLAENVYATVASEYLAKLGLELSPDSIRRHNRGLCRC